MSRSFEKLREAMVQANAPSKPLYIDMEKYCLRNGLKLEEAFFNSANVPPAIIELWLKDREFATWVEGRRARRDGRRWFYKDQPPKELKDNAVAVMGEHFVAAPRGDGLFLYAITDQ